MLRVDLLRSEIGRTRFAITPLFELICLLRRLIAGSRRTFPTGWADRLTPTYRELRRETELDAVLGLLPSGRGPGFLAPPPGRGLDQDVADDLAVVRATPSDQARAEIADALGDLGATTTAARRLLAREDLVRRVADTLETAWIELLAIDWPALRAVCERDVYHRAEQICRSGWQAAMRDLHPDIDWAEDAATLPRFQGERTTTSDGEGLLLIPSVFVWPGIAAHVGPGWRRTIIYPARGVGTLWTEATEFRPGALGQLIGKSRALILIALAESSSTSQLARTLGMATGAVGDHLAVLRDNGLVDRTRVGKSVLYRRTPLGESIAQIAVPRSSV